jgi:mono/diheme cytochrome c family protein
MLRRDAGQGSWLVHWGRSVVGWAAALVVLWAGGGVSAAQDRQTGAAPVPSLAGESLSGRDSYESFCASCHGRAGRGDGPVAPALRTPPPDLTRLAQRNGGTYPSARVEAFVTGTGRTLAAHGTTEMPIWGSTFRAFEADARVRQRIQNLVRHIETLQQPTSAPSDPGAVLFKTHCASCHGADARGGGPAAVALRRVPPDLTGYAERNAGVFPSEKLARIIDGRDVTAHGDREMPVWGDVFTRAGAGETPEAVSARIAAIVRYVQAIQRRPAE